MHTSCWTVAEKRSVRWVICFCCFVEYREVQLRRCLILLVIQFWMVIEGLCKLNGGNVASIFVQLFYMVQLYKGKKANIYITRKTYSTRKHKISEAVLWNLKLFCEESDDICSFFLVTPSHTNKINYRKISSSNFSRSTIFCVLEIMRGNNLHDAL